MKFNKFVFAAALFVIFSAGSTRGISDVICAWDFSGLTGGANNFGPSPLSATFTSNVTITGLTRYTSILTGNTGAQYAWGGNNFSLSAASSSDAITALNYWTFSVTPNSGKTINFSDIGAYNVRRSGTGPSNGLWQYKINSGAFKDIGASFSLGSVTSSSGNAMNSVALSGIGDLQNLTSASTVTFRFIMWGATGQAGTCYFNDPLHTSAYDLSINGNTALPVRLVSLSSRISGRTARLVWSTDSEIDNNGFFVERKKTGGSDWTTAGFVKGNGTVNGISEYSFTDRGLETGLYAYRLKQMDYNGRFEHFNFEGDVVIGTPDKFMLSQNYPNPFNPVTKIDMEIPYDGRVSLRIYDLAGREIMSVIDADMKAGYYTRQFDASALSSGVYFYRMTAGSYSGVRKMTVIR